MQRVTEEELYDVKVENGGQKKSSDDADLLRYEKSALYK